MRTFKTVWFSKAARKAHITDADLCLAIEQVRLGQADDLGGGVYKKRLDKNRHRSIILAKGSRFWVYEYLFAKKDFANISGDDLSRFRDLAKEYAVVSEPEISALIKQKIWMEICNADQA